MRILLLQLALLYIISASQRLLIGAAVMPPTTVVHGTVTNNNNNYCTRVDSHHIECSVPDEALRFFVIGNIGGGEQPENTAGGTVSTVGQPPTVGQHAVACAMDALAKRNGAPHFVLNLGNNFYGHCGVTHEDVQQRFKENFVDVYNYDSLQVPWYTIAGNNDWDSKDGIAPQMKQLNRQWTFPAEHYTVQYSLGNGLKTRLIMIDTTKMCGKEASYFGKLRPKGGKKYNAEIKTAKQHLKWLKQELKEARRV